MDDYQMARLALDAVRTATRLAQQEQRRRERNRAAAAREAAAQSQGGQAASPMRGRTPGHPTQAASQGLYRSAGESQSPEANQLQRRPEFEMPANPDGEIPDEFLPRV